MVLRPWLTAAFLEAHELPSYSRLAAFQCGLVSWESIDLAAEQIPALPKGVAAPQAALPAATLAFRAWRVARKWIPPPISEPRDEEFMAAHPSHEPSPGYFHYMEGRLEEHVVQGLRLMSWPVSDEVLQGAVQLAAAEATAFHSSSLAKEALEERAQEAAERKAAAMAKLLLAEEARTASKASKKSQKALQAGCSSKPGKASRSKGQQLPQKLPHTSSGSNSEVGGGEPMNQPSLPGHASQAASPASAENAPPEDSAGSRSPSNPGSACEAAELTAPGNAQAFSAISSRQLHSQCKRSSQPTASRVSDSFQYHII